MYTEKAQNFETSILPWEQTELTAVLRLRHLGTIEAKERVLDEIVTDGAEMIDVPMTTRRELFIRDGRMITAEGEQLREMWERGKIAQHKRALSDGRFWSEYWRNCYEADEQAIFEEEVIPSFIHNTQVTFSAYAQDQENKYGAEFIDQETHYKRERKFGLIRILYQTSPETAEVVSISIDNSHQLAAIQKVAETLGQPIPDEASSTDLLGHHIQTFIQPEERLDFERQLINIYDKELSRQLGGEFYQGRPKETLGIEAFSFVMANQDLLAIYAHEIDKVAANDRLVGKDLLKAVRLIRRSYMASLYERHESHDSSRVFEVRSAENIDYNFAYQEMLAAGMRVTERGIRLIGCGTAIEAMHLLENMSDKEFKQLLTTKEEKYEFDTEMHCVVCQSKPKKDEPKKMCGPCGICRTCDAKLKTKKKAA